jgi:hypothetical protein
MRKFIIIAFVLGLTGCGMSPAQKRALIVTGAAAIAVGIIATSHGGQPGCGSPGECLAQSFTP